MISPLKPKCLSLSNYKELLLSSTRGLGSGLGDRRRLRCPAQTARLVPNRPRDGHFAAESARRSDGGIRSVV
jgi:hypothetical protein